MSLFPRWAEKEYGPGVRIIATLLAGVVFAIVLPYLLLVICPSLDERLWLDRFSPGVATLMIGGILLAVGLFFALWSILVQLTRGRGTPLPMMPTQRLLMTGPFRSCRNRMTLGTILAYLGLTTAAATTAGVILVLVLAALLLVYLKRVEEKELAERFGADYFANKRDVPFIVPKIPRRS